MHSRSALAGTAALLVAILAGCTTAPTPAPRAGLDLRTTTRPAADEWSADVTLAGPARYADGTVTAYIADEGELAIAAWDAGTGRELWRDSADSGGEGPRTTPVPAMLSAGDLPYVAYIGRRAEAPYTELVVVRVDTGGRIEVPDAVFLPGGLPWRCGSALCVQRAAVTGTSRDATVPWPTLRIDPRRPVLRVSPAESLPPGTEPTGAGLVQLRGSSPARDAVAAHRGTRILWRARVAELFGRGIALNGGSSWLRAAGVLVGTGLRATAAKTGVSARLTRQAVVGLDPASGRVQWRRRDLGRCADGAGLQSVAGAIITCAWESGTLRLTGGTDAPTTIASPRYRIVAIDPATGATRWRSRTWTDASVFIDARRGERPPRYAAPDSFVIGGARPWVVDLASGRTRALRAAAIVACRNPPGLVATSWENGGAPVSLGTAGGYSACGRDRTPRDRWSVAAVRAVGLHLDGDFWLVREPGRLRAVSLPAR